MNLKIEVMNYNAMIAGISGYEQVMLNRNLKRPVQAVFGSPDGIFVFAACGEIILAKQACCGGIVLCG